MKIVPLNVGVTEMMLLFKWAVLTLYVTLKLNWFVAAGNESWRTEIPVIFEHDSIVSFLNSSCQFKFNWLDREQQKETRSSNWMDNYVMSEWQAVNVSDKVFSCF